MLEWILSSAALCALVIGLRYLLRGKIGLRLQYALWGLVLLRLLLPVSFGSSRLSLMNALPGEKALLPAAAFEGDRQAGNKENVSRPEGNCLLQDLQYYHRSLLIRRRTRPRR